MDVEVLNKMDNMIEIESICRIYHASLLKQYVKRLNTMPDSLMTEETVVLPDESFETVANVDIDEREENDFFFKYKN